MLNVVLKIFTKWLTTRLNTSITTIVNQDQGSFMPGKEAVDNLRRVLQILWEVRDDDDPIAAFSWDAENVFNRVGSNADIYNMPLASFVLD